MHLKLLADPLARHLLGRDDRVAHERVDVLEDLPKVRALQLLERDILKGNPSQEVLLEENWVE